MLPRFNITVEDFDQQSHVVEYELLDNSIAPTWYRKINHLYRVPLDRHYTQQRQIESLAAVQHTITQDLLALKNLVGLEYTVKDAYDQNDCNVLHAMTIDTQYSHESEVRDVFHRMHRAIHKLEDYLNGTVLKTLTVGWGEQEGPLKTKFSAAPYSEYKMPRAGEIYLGWSEFGKTPYQYWRDDDANDVENFFKTCKPHETFRGLFVLALDFVEMQFPAAFDQWFDQYRAEWELKYGHGWLPLHEWGGVPLGRPLIEFDWSTVNTVLAIQPV